jgi:hypothetical protein
MTPDQQTIVDLINARAATEAGAADWAGVATILAAVTVEQLDATPLTYARITALFGDTSRQLVAGTIRAGAVTDGELADAHAVMLDEMNGLRIDSPARQTVIDDLALAGSWPDALRDGIKALGRVVVAPWQSVGLSAAPSATDAQAAWDASVLEADFATQMNDTITPAIASGRAALVAAFNAAAANLGA